MSFDIELSWLWEYLYDILLSSSYQKYDPYVIV